MTHDLHQSGELDQRGSYCAHELGQLFWDPKPGCHKDSCFFTASHPSRAHKSLLFGIPAKAVLSVQQVEVQRKLALAVKQELALDLRS